MHPYHSIRHDDSAIAEDVPFRKLAKFNPTSNLNESLDQVFSKIKIEKHEIRGNKFDYYVDKASNLVSHADEIKNNDKEFRKKNLDSKLFEAEFLHPNARR